MNKEDLIEALATESGFTKVDAKKFLDAYLTVVPAALAKGESIQLIGFATISVSERAARKGRNPQTGKEINIPASKVIKFVAGKQLKEAVNHSKSGAKKATTKK